MKKAFGMTENRGLEGWNQQAQTPVQAVRGPLRIVPSRLRIAPGLLRIVPSRVRSVPGRLRIVPGWVGVVPGADSTAPSRDLLVPGGNSTGLNAGLNRRGGRRRCVGWRLVGRCGPARGARSGFVSSWSSKRSQRFFHLNLPILGAVLPPGLRRL